MASPRPSRRPPRSNKALAAAVDAAQPVQVDHLAVIAAHADLPLDLARLAEQIERYRSHPAECTQGEWVDAGFAEDWFAGAQKWDTTISSLRVPLSALQLGPIGMLFHPSELYSYYGLAIKRGSPFAETLSVGYTDDFIGYVSDPEAFVKGEYAALVVPKLVDLPPYMPEAGRRAGPAGDRATEKAWGPGMRAVRLWALACRSAIGILLAGAALAARANELPPPLAPAAALATIHAPAGFRVEQVAAEPLVAGPVAIDWGPDGKLWVAEMISIIPSAWTTQASREGRICWLADRDGDGRFDRRVSFLDDVAFPNGVMAWRDGVVVTAAGRSLFRSRYRRRRSSRRAAHAVRWLQSGNQQHRVNGPRWGWMAGVIWRTAIAAARSARRPPGRRSTSTAVICACGPTTGGWKP